MPPNAWNNSDCRIGNDSGERAARPRRRPRRRAGVDVRLTDRALQDAIKAAIGERRGYLGDWWVDEAGWCVELLSPERETFHGLTLEIALAWCLVCLMPGELRDGDPASPAFARATGNAPRWYHLLYRTGIDGLFSDDPGLAVATRDEVF